MQAVQGRLRQVVAEPGRSQGQMTRIMDIFAGPEIARIGLPVDGCLCCICLSWMHPLHLILAIFQLGVGRRACSLVALGQFVVHDIPERIIEQTAQRELLIAKSICDPAEERGLEGSHFLPLAGIIGCADGIYRAHELCSGAFSITVKEQLFKKRLPGLRIHAGKFYCLKLIDIVSFV